MVIGIDYSLTSPAMCIMMEPNYDMCVFYYLTTNKKLVGNFGNAIGYEHKEYFSEQERYDNIAEFFLNKIPTVPTIPHVFIEDYSFGSKGKVFHIAENCGLLKYKLWEIGLRFTTIPPTVIKKFATGKGNADKAKMHETFLAETGENLIPYFSKSGTLTSPVTDIVDSYYIAKYGFSTLKKDVKNGPNVNKKSKH